MAMIRAYLRLKLSLCGHQTTQNCGEGVDMSEWTTDPVDDPTAPGWVEPAEPKQVPEDPDDDDPDKEDE